MLSEKLNNDQKNRLAANQLLLDVRPVMIPLMAPKPMGKPTVTNQISSSWSTRPSSHGYDEASGENLPAKKGFLATSNRTSGRGDIVNSNDMSDLAVRIVLKVQNPGGKTRRKPVAPPSSPIVEMTRPTIPTLRKATV